MKKIIGAFLFTVFFININYTVALNYEENVKIDSNFSEFELLEKYLKNHKKKLISFQNKYEIIDNQKLTFYIWEISELEELANTIYKNKKIDYNRQQVSEEIVKKIKNINTQLKEILIYEKYKFEKNLEKKHRVYSFIGEEIWNSIYRRIENQIIKIKESEISKENKLKIVIHLRNLETNALYFKNFKNLTFKNQNEMKIAFTSVLTEIKKDLSEINNLLQK